jgi:hypothetical protein
MKNHDKLTPRASTTASSAVFQLAGYQNRLRQGHENFAEKLPWI